MTQTQPGGARFFPYIMYLHTLEHPDLGHVASSLHTLQHPDLGFVSYSLQTVSDEPDQQVGEVIGLMRDYVLADAQRPELAADLARATAGAAGSDGEMARAIFTHVKGRMGYQVDSLTAAPLESGLPWPVVEALIRPLDLVTMCEQGGCRRVGDCDDYAMYVAALLTVARIPNGFVTLAADRSDPERYSHVYVVAYTREGRLALDASHGPYPGWEAENWSGKRREWPVWGALTATSAAGALALAMLLAGAAAWAAGRWLS